MPQFYPNSLLANRYLLLKKIGEGGFAEVWKASDKLAGDMEVAIKILLPRGGGTEAVMQQFVKEYSSTFLLQHPNLLKATHLDKEGEHFFIVMPLCRQGSLEDAMVKQTHFDEETIADIIYQLTDALAYLHKQKLLHNDIKPANILIGKGGEYMLSDFGISTHIKTTLYGYSRLQNPESKDSFSAMSIAYAAPEIFSANPIQSPASDVFALGVTMYEIMSKALPWMGQGGIVLRNGAEVPHLPATYSKNIDAWIRKCMDAEPYNRPTIVELKEAATFFLENGYWKLPEGVTTSTYPSGKFVEEKLPTISQKSQPLITKNTLLIGLIGIVLGGFGLWALTPSTKEVGNITSDATQIAEKPKDSISPKEIDMVDVSEKKPIPSTPNIEPEKKTQNKSAEANKRTMPELQPSPNPSPQPSYPLPQPYDDKQTDNRGGALTPTDKKIDDKGGRTPTPDKKTDNGGALTPTDKKTDNKGGALTPADNKEEKNGGELTSANIAYLNSKLKAERDAANAIHNHIYISYKAKFKCNFEKNIEKAKYWSNINRINNDYNQLRNDANDLPFTTYKKNVDSEVKALAPAIDYFHKLAAT